MAGRSSPYLIDFPTLFVAADWVSAHCVVPDGFAKGDPFELVDWQLWALLNFYRVRGDARVGQLAPAFFYRRSQIVLPQKAGKAPYSAAHICVEGVGPALFAGWAVGGEVWDCREHGCGCGWVYEYRPGEPMAVPWATPLIQVTATSEEQADNIYDALRPMIDAGPLMELIPKTGEEFIRLPHGGRIDVVTSNARSRLGQRVTFCPQDETGIWTATAGMIKVAETQRRGLAGMGGRAEEPLALDTPVPTPHGWSTVGALQPGDEVFGGDGRPVAVACATEVFHDLPCFRVTFDDGEQIVASASHGWTVRRQHTKKPERCHVLTRTTADLVLDLTHHYSLSLPTVAIHGATVELPVDPYFLGLWLGDGATDDSVICCARDIAGELADLVRGALQPHEELVLTGGHGCVRMRPKRRHRLCRWGHDWSNDAYRNGGGVVTCGKCGRGELRAVAAPLLTMRERLRGIGVLGHKHIPKGYLRSGIDQRQALLRGLIDSDGCIDKKGRASFCNTNRVLVLQVRDLLVSLGYKPRVTWRTRAGLTAGYVGFVPMASLPVARVSHKVERHNESVPIVAARRYIVAVESVPSVPTRCVGIDSADHLFVVGQRNTLTHNTTNAWDPSEHSVAQRTAESRRPDIFRLHPDAPASLSYTNKAERRKIHRIVYRGCHWIDQDAIEAEAQELIEEDPVQAERFFGNRAVAGGGKAFDAEVFAQLAVSDSIASGRKATLGFDGALFFDSTGLIATDVETGLQTVVGFWERPPYLADEEDWEVPIGEVNEAVAFAFDFWDVWRLYGDPPHYREDLSRWAGLYGDKRVIEWWTNANKQMGYALREYRTSMRTAALSHGPLNDSPEAQVAHEAFMAHIANAVKRPTKIRVEEQSDDGETKQTAQFLWTIRKESQKSRKRIDLAMAGCLSWRARQDAIRSGALNPEPTYARAAWQ